MITIGMGSDKREFFYDDHNSYGRPKVKDNEVWIVQRSPSNKAPHHDVDSGGVFLHCYAGDKNPIFAILIYLYEVRQKNNGRIGDTDYTSSIMREIFDY
jgi:hypothetical protein